MEGKQEPSILLSGIDQSELPPKARRRSTTKTGISSGDIAAATALLCNAIASVRGPHWEKQAGDCLPLSEPLARYIDNMSPSQREVAQQVILPVSILLGGIMVFAYPLGKEIEYAQLARKPRKIQTPISTRNGSTGPAEQSQSQSVSVGYTDSDGSEGFGFSTSDD